MNHFALTIVGRDRAGIVSQVTEILFNLGCNIADSSCSILGGQFAMILILAHPDYSDQASFGEAFKPLEEADLTVALRVLKPGGRLVFCEHGKAPDENVRKWQDRITPVWKVIGGGCHVGRPIPDLIREGGFEIEKMETMYLPATPKFAGFNYWGTAK